MILIGFRADYSEKYYFSDNLFIYSKNTRKPIDSYLGIKV